MLETQSSAPSSSSSVKSQAERLDFSLIMDSVSTIFAKYSAIQIASELITYISALIQIYLVYVNLGIQITAQICAVYPIIILCNVSIPRAVNKAFKLPMMNALTRKQKTTIQVYTSYQLVVYFIFFVFCAVFISIFRSKLDIFAESTSVQVYAQIHICFAIISTGLKQIISAYLFCERKMNEIVYQNVTEQVIKLNAVYILFLINATLKTQMSAEKLVRAVAIIQVCCTFITLIYHIYKLILTENTDYQVKVKIQSIFPINPRVFLTTLQTTGVHLIQNCYEAAMLILVMFFYQHSDHNNSNYKLCNQFSLFLFFIFKQMSNAGNSGSVQILEHLFEMNWKTQKYDRILQILQHTILLMMAYSFVIAPITYKMQLEYLNIGLTQKDESFQYYLRSTYKMVSYAPIIGSISSASYIIIPLLDVAKTKMVEIFLVAIQYVYLAIMIICSLLLKENFNYYMMYFGSEILQAVLGIIIFIVLLQKQHSVVKETSKIHAQKPEDQSAPSVIVLLEPANDSTSSLHNSSSTKLIDSKEKEPSKEQTGSQLFGVSRNQSQYLIQSARIDSLQIMRIDSFQKSSEKSKNDDDQILVRK
ncbi:Conserved_hypothetical protein [Hexamita inflata]|uniref:DinF protein n=1 Tax=Hexamita inflata TaxID=28002 RepID=A0AA86TII9_9EUKA|nr:Conserved hypothetical protein [Hexamita inflata]